MASAVLTKADQDEHHLPVYSTLQQLLGQDTDALAAADARYEGLAPRVPGGIWRPPCTVCARTW